MNQQAKICVPVCARLASELSRAFDSACEVADLVELRLDYLPESELAIAAPVVQALIDARRKPVILTLRPVEFGGARPISIDQRLAFRKRIISLRSTLGYSDVEHDLARRIQSDIYLNQYWNWDRTICSYHNFSGVPDLGKIYEELAQTPAAILKIAFRAHNTSDCLEAFKLLERAQGEDRELIAVAMGQAGVITRVLGPSRGSFLTYGSLDRENASAPGQIRATELRDVYRIHRLDDKTQIFGVIGKPVSHSLSPVVHNAAFAAAGLNAVYLPIEVHTLPPFMHDFVNGSFRWNLRGLSVTAPHKTAVIDYLSDIDPFAKEIAAVNTVVIRNEELWGYNTDADGFIVPLRKAFGSLKGAKVAVIGAGGASRAALSALRRDGALTVLYARNPGKAETVGREFGSRCLSLAGASFDGFDIVVNTTPRGTRGFYEELTAATARQLRGVQLAYDLVYNPLETRFMREAQAAGCRTIGGLEMFLAQAAEQFRLWSGQEPDLQVMRGAAVSRLAQQNCETSEREIQPADSI